MVTLSRDLVRLEMGEETPRVEDRVGEQWVQVEWGFQLPPLELAAWLLGGGQMLPPLELAAVLLHVPGFLDFLEKAGVLVPGLVFVKNA